MTPAELHIIRKNYGLTQEEFGKLLSPPVSRLTVYNWEKGKFAIPHDLEQRMVDANLAAPITQKSAGKVINSNSHPACYHQVDKNNYARTLLHPKWWAGVGSPFERLCSEEQWKQVEQRSFVSELATYIPPTIEQAHELMVSRGISFEVASRYLIWMGYALPEHLKPAISDEQRKAVEYNTALAHWNATHHPDEQGFGPFEEANPQYREQRKRHEPTQEEIEKSLAVQKALDDAFKL